MAKAKMQTKTKKSVGRTGTGMVGMSKKINPDACGEPGKGWTVKSGGTGIKGARARRPADTHPG